jgi:hypothetical protein
VLPNYRKERIPMMMNSKPKQLAIATVLAVSATGSAQAGGLSPVWGAFGETKPILDFRLRSESVHQDGLLEDAEALTLRGRLGFETGKAWNTTLLVEGDFLVPIIDNYRPDATVPTMTTYPVVPDPESYEINRLQLVNTSIPGTTLTLGRQRIALDDQRFIGPVGWRQNEQTFDGLRVVNRTVTNLVIDVTYFDQVDRLFGPESPQGRYKGDSFLGNVSYQTKVGKITAFGYLLDFGLLASAPPANRLQGLRDSTSTYGLRFAGEKPVGKIKLAYSASYAEQTEWADNPLVFDLGYIAAEVTGTWKQFSFGLGEEILEGNGVKGFTTPLATLHKFQGWADKFLVTPAQGLEDKYANFGVTLKGVGPLDTLSTVVSYHDYKAENISADYGHEWNLQVSAKWKRFNGMLKYADYYQGSGLPATRDTDKLWAQVEFVW